jgi:hypothetical protein
MRSDRRVVKGAEFDAEFAGDTGGEPLRRRFCLVVVVDMGVISVGLGFYGGLVGYQDASMEVN